MARGRQGSDRKFLNRLTSLAWRPLQSAPRRRLGRVGRHIKSCNQRFIPVNTSSLLRMQWNGYARYHQSRPNLLLHIVFVPLFLAGNVAFPLALIERRWLLALGAAALSGIALAVQGAGHREEPMPAEPFTSPFNALSRILVEQWVTFPRFVLSGAWMRALRERSTLQKGNAP